MKYLFDYIEHLNENYKNTDISDKIDKFLSETELKGEKEKINIIDLRLLI